MPAEAVMAEEMAEEAKEEAQVAAVARVAVAAGPSPVGEAATTAAAVRVEAAACRCTRRKCCRWSCSSCPS